MTYPLGWPVLMQTVVRKERWPGGNVQCIPLVYPGQEVLPDQPVLRIEHEKVEAVQAVPMLSLPATGQLDVESVLESSKADMTGETLPAGLRGRVVDVTRRGGVVIESRVALIEGIVGVGNQVAGVLTMWQSSDANNGTPQAIPPGAILAIPGPLSFAMLRQAIHSGVTGIVASSMMARDLEGFLRADLIQLLNRENSEQAHLPPLTLLLTEGFGMLAMSARLINLLSQHQGTIVLLSGATSIREGIFPELIISLPVKETQQNWHPIQPDPTLTIGAQVRVCSGEHEGAIGMIDYLFAYEQVFSGGIRARATRLCLEDGSVLVVPIMLVERIG